jgi:hypothetical protein
MPLGTHTNKETQMPTEGPTPRHTAALDRLVTLIAEAGLPDPDVCEYGASEVRLSWTDRKVAVVIDLEDLEPVAA